VFEVKNMELEKGSVVVIKLIIETDTDQNVYKELLKKIGKVGVIYDCFRGVKQKMFYSVCFFNRKDNENFYEEELEVIGFDNSFSTKCYSCSSRLKVYSFKHNHFKYCPKCLV